MTTGTADLRNPVLELGGVADETTVSNERGISLIMTAANSAKTVLGAGILSLSWAYFYSTMWPGVFFTVVMCLLAAYGFYVLGVCSEMTGMKAYGEIWKQCFGAGMMWLPNVVTLTYILLSNTAYLIICGDYVPRAINGLGAHHVLQNRYYVILLVSLVIAPLNFLRDLSFLGPFSMLGTAGALYTCCVLFFEAVDLPTEQRHVDWEPFGFGAGLFLMIPNVTFAFNGHFSASDMYQKLDRRSPARWLLVTALAFGLCFIITLVCSISGYIMFGTDLGLEGRSNVLNAPVFKKKPEIMIAYIATTISVSLGIPLYTHGARDAVEALWLQCRGSGEPGDNAMRRHFITFLCTIFTIGLSMVVEDLGLLNSIAGAVCASLLMFVFPSMMYLKCTSSSAQGRSVFGNAVYRGLPWCSIIIGAIVGVAGVVTSVLSTVGVNLKPH